MTEIPAPETYDRVLALRVTRRFTNEPIPAEEVDALLEAARWTGSSKNLQGWAFVVLDAPEDLARAAEAGSFSTPLRHATLGIALVRTPEGHDWDLGRAAQNIMLAADARGIGSCPITLHEKEKADAALSIPPDHECRWVIALGYPDVEAEEADRNARRRSGGLGRGRKAASEIVHRGRFGA